MADVSMLSALLSAEHPQGELTGTANRLQLAVEAPADDAMIQRRVDPAISRRVRRGRDAVDVFKRVVLVSGAVLGDAQIVHRGAFGQPGQSPLELVGRKP